MTNIKVVCNTSPIIGLMKIRQLPLLWHIFWGDYAVYRELCTDSVGH